MLCMHTFAVSVAVSLCGFYHQRGGKIKHAIWLTRFRSIVTFLHSFYVHIHKRISVDKIGLLFDF